MPSERYYYDDKFTDHYVVLQDQEFHHLTHVIRSKKGESVELVNGRGELACAIIEKLDKKQALLKINEVISKPLPQNQVVLVQAIPRMNRLDFILEKGTELGMTQIWLFASDKSERKALTDHQLERMRFVTIAAMKQCGRLYLPEMKIYDSLDEIPIKSMPAFFGDTNPHAPLFRQVWNKKAEDSDIAFYIGPESGFTDKEINFLHQNGASGVKLHSNILRTDTAALAALAIIEQLKEEKNSEYR
jgi:16S rRNA (uracil1498-N3)-methyltransferase